MADAANGGASTASYKEAHEAFMTGLTGTTPLEVLMVLSVVSLSVLLHRFVFALLVPTLLGNNIDETSPSKKLPYALHFVLEFVVVCLPSVCSFTLCADILPRFIASLGAVCATIGIIAKCFRPDLWKSFSFGVTTTRSIQQLSCSRKSFLDNYRAAMLYSTCVAILAVDFVIFPRRFAKTESYGISVMDIGVGAFLFSNALVSPNAKTSLQGLSFGERLGMAVKKASPMVVLGLGRIITTKGVDYQEHVSEYGAHWNFFFTLAVVSMLVIVMNVPPKNGGLVGVLLCLVYQFLLSSETTNLAGYILDHPRDSLIAQNKEGICSCLGYFAIFLIGCEAGNWIHIAGGAKSSSAAGNANQVRTWWRTAVKLFLVGGVLWVVALLSAQYIDGVSRRMANMPYVLIVVAIDLFLLASLLLIELTTTPVEIGIATALNRNGLALFLIANVGTGVVNMSMETIYAEERVAFVVVGLYCFAVCVIAAVLHNMKVTLKYW
eukprot:TRINITY_DN6087_c0_g1_i1.p1 TRINITY_DN6087_c0_g1~~TRINITY_DN6087_c0_g1_i1.p1  ORF type:complete len:502 (-),score=118.18 TRINITY_DN6087_c0_g1_i1:62-1540(-)